MDVRKFYIKKLIFKVLDMYFNIKFNHDMIDKLRFLKKHNVRTSVLIANYNLNININIVNLDQIFVRDTRNGKTFHNQFPTKISIKSKHHSYVKIFANGLIHINTNNFSNLCLTIKKICKKLNINIDTNIINTNIQIRQIICYCKMDIDIDNNTKMNKYNPNCNITIEKHNELNIYELKYEYNKNIERTFIYPHNRVKISSSSLDDIINKYLYFNKYLQVPTTLLTLSKDTNSLFSYLPIELIEYIMFSL